ncbi:hypothetical protein, partial [Streptomyces niveus]|uniref:hypothetical protein n=1 Tax=Streptomyces niveus TaxID=193462 RepID=UPI003682FA85
MITPTTRPSLTKTRPTYHGHTGAMLRDALEALGIVHHVDQPRRGLPTEYLVCSMPGRARVWIHCVADPSAHTPEGRRFADHYDLPTVALWWGCAPPTHDKKNPHLFKRVLRNNTPPPARRQ